MADARPESLPLGIKQRLQLAVAVLHRPAILILDEPTSGVDPIARDAFWHTLIDLSRDDGVTIFLSTHFMNEAERCDRISLMHAGKVLAVGTPQDLVKERGSDSLEDAFVDYLVDAAGICVSACNFDPLRWGIGVQKTPLGALCAMLLGARPPRMRRQNHRADGLSAAARLSQIA